jgi:hypothetical protein
MSKMFRTIRRSISWSHRLRLPSCSRVQVLPSTTTEPSRRCIRPPTKARPRLRSALATIFPWWTETISVPSMMCKNSTFAQIDHTRGTAQQTASHRTWPTPHHWRLRTLDSQAYTHPRHDTAFENLVLTPSCRQNQTHVQTSALLFSSIHSITIITPLICDWVASHSTHHYLRLLLALLIQVHHYNRMQVVSA